MKCCDDGEQGCPDGIFCYFCRYDITLKICFRMVRRIFSCLFFFCLSVSAFLAGPRVLFIGDSITDGNWGCSDGSAMPSAERNLWDMNHIYGSGYMYLCASYYQSMYPEREYRFFNRGISGNTLADLEGRWDEDVLALEPDVLSVLVGTNDVHYYIAGDMSLPFDTLAWERRYRSLLDRSLAKNPNLKVVLGAPFTAFTGTMRESDNYALRDSLVHVLSGIVERIASDYRAVYLPYDVMFETILRDEPISRDTYWIWDGIHPTPAGHRRMSELWIREAGHARLFPLSVPCE